MRFKSTHLNQVNEERNDAAPSSYPTRVGINWTLGSACVVSNSWYRKW